MIAILILVLLHICLVGYRISVLKSEFGDNSSRHEFGVKKKNMTFS